MDPGPIVEHVARLCTEIYRHWESRQRLKAELLPFKKLVESVQSAVDNNRNTLPGVVLGKPLLCEPLLMYRMVSRQSLQMTERLMTALAAVSIRDVKKQIA